MLVESLSSHDCADGTMSYLPLTESLTRSSIGTYTNLYLSPAKEHMEWCVRAID